MANRINYGPWVVAAALAASAALLWFYYPRTPAPVVAPPAVTAPAAAPAAAADAPLAPAPSYPVDQIPLLPEGPPPPPLAESDGAFLEAASAALGGDAARWLVAEFVVPRLVATVDNLPRRALTRQIYVARPLPGDLGVAEADGRLWLDAGNAGRYDAAVATFEQLDSRRAVGAYVQWYPRLQQAYAELGEGDRQFNDRLIEVIDHLLAAPDVSGPLELRRAANGRPRLEFADPEREAASVGHKAMWRLGPDHAARVKAKLRELRTLLAGQRPAA